MVSVVAGVPKGWPVTTTMLSPGLAQDCCWISLSLAPFDLSLDYMLPKRCLPAHTRPDLPLSLIVTVAVVYRKVHVEGLVEVINVEKILQPILIGFYHPVMFNHGKDDIAEIYRTGNVPASENLLG